jgi:pimeloyl-ACP methyl ester carboxylesterase
MRNYKNTGDQNFVCPPISRTIRDFATLAGPGYWLTPKPDPSLPRGNGHTVLIAPGMGCTDLFMRPVCKYFQALGYDAQGWKVGLNLGPTKRIMSRLESSLFSLNDHTGRRISLVGKSLGGMVMRELAKKYPDRVRRLILLCAPVQHPVVNRVAPLLYLLKPLFDESIPNSDEELSRPAQVPTTAFFTKNDGLVAWQCCLERPSSLAENIELLGAYHTTSGMEPFALRVMAERLALPDRV